MGFASAFPISRPLSCFLLPGRLAPAPSPAPRASGRLRAPAVPGPEQSDRPGSAGEEGRVRGPRLAWAWPGPDRGSDPRFSRRSLRGRGAVVHEPQGHTPSLRERVTLAHAHYPPHARPRTRQTHKPSGGRSQCQRRLSPSRRAPPPPLSTGSGKRPAWSPRQAQCQPRAQPPGVQYLCPDRGAGLQGPERWLHDEPRGQPRAPGGAQAARLRPSARKAEATLHQGNGACGA